MNHSSLCKLTIIAALLLTSACDTQVNIEEENADGADATNIVQQGTNQTSQEESLKNTASKKYIEVVAGVQYLAGTYLNSPEVGVSLVVPSNYVGTLNNGETFLLTSNDQSSSIIMQISEQDFNATVTQMSNTIDLGNGLYLQPLTSVSQDSDTLSARYEIYGSNNPSTAYVVNKYRDQSKGVLILGITRSENIDNLVQTVNELTKSIGFSEPIQSSSQFDSNNYWVQQFSNLKLTNTSRASDYSETETFYLCSDGRYRWTRVSSGSSLNGSLLIPTEKTGTWTASGNSANGTLTVNNTDGTQFSYTITPTTDNVGVYLDNDLSYRTKIEC